jgi:hypothetical protein
MGKLILTENGQTTVRNFTHIVRVSRYGRLGHPEPFDGTLHLVTGIAQRTLEVYPGSQVEQTPLIERLLLWVSLLVTGSALHRLVLFLFW